MAQKLAIFFKHCWSAPLMDAVALGKSEDNFLEFSALTVTAKLFSMQKHNAHRQHAKDVEFGSLIPFKALRLQHGIQKN